jgi:hypothetical protein
MEAAAKAEARKDEIKKGFELLFASAFPEHAKKAADLDEFAKALSEYAHLGRHEAFPALQITRSEAEFVYTSTLGFFALLGRRLADTKAMNPSG